MTKIQLRLMERNVSLLQKLLSDLGSSTKLKEFLRNIRRPGFTTPAEFILVKGGIDALNLQGKALTSLLNSVTGGANSVGH